MLAAHSFSLFKFSDLSWMRQIHFNQSNLVVLLSKYFLFVFQPIEIRTHTQNLLNPKSGKPRKLGGCQKNIRRDYSSRWRLIPLSTLCSLIYSPNLFCHAGLWSLFSHGLSLNSKGIFHVGILWTTHLCVMCWFSVDFPVMKRC